SGDTAQPVRDLDSQAKVKMRRNVRGLRAIERRVLADRRQAAASAPPLPQESPQGDDALLINPSAAATAAPGAPGALGLATTGNAPVEDEAGEGVLGYCAAGGGVFHDSQGGPLRPPRLPERA